MLQSRPKYDGICNDVLTDSVMYVSVKRSMNKEKQANRTFGFSLGDFDIDAIWTKVSRTLFKKVIESVGSSHRTAIKPRALSAVLYRLLKEKAKFEKFWILFFRIKISTNYSKSALSGSSTWRFALTIVLVMSRV